jgi:spore coat protein CotH
MQNSLATNPSNVKQIKKTLNSVVYQIKSMISESDDGLSAQIQNSSQTLASELDGMKGQLTNIQQLSQPGSYIDPSNLPFTVQFIDNVSGQNVVTVSYNNLLTPLSVGESLAGWTLVSSDYASQYAVFQNSKDQLVKASNTAAGQGE